MENDAVINAILSFFIPGLGQAIEGYKIRGLIFFVIALLIGVVVYFYNVESAITYAIYIIYCLIVAYDAYRLY